MSEPTFDRLEAYRAHIAAAAESAEPTEDFVLALRYFLLAAAFERLPELGSDRLQTLADLLRPAAFAVAETTTKPSNEELFFGVACATGLFRQLGLPAAEREAPILTGVRLEQIALLADELDANLRRARIAKAGDPIRRALRIHLAQAAERAGAPLN